jgi:GT2 family glycosyltransferase
MSRLERVSVAVLSWNGKHHLETCLAALEAQRDPGVPWEILVLDNGSSDGTVEWLARRHPRVRTLASPVNLGFCAGNNRLVEEAQGDAVALLNNDTRPRPDWLAELVRAYRESPEDVAGVSGLIVDWEEQRLDFARGAMTFDGHAFQLDFRRPLAQVALPPEGAELPFGCGGNLLVRRASYLAAGGFDLDYFAYLEDVDLGWRLWSGGERVIFTPQAVVAHRSSATSDLLGLFNRGFLFERNAFLTAYKNYDAEHWPRLMPAVMLTLTARTQALLERNNPGGGLLRIDPYAGWIADTAARDPGAPGKDGPGQEAARPAPPPAAEGLPARWRRRWRELGGRGFLHRGATLLLDRWVGNGQASKPAVELTDERSIAQLRAQSYLLGHLGEADAKRRRVQERRRVPDRALFERFPLYVVPTYPGDVELFATDGFRRWFPDDVPCAWRQIGDLMELG